MLFFVAYGLSLQSNLPIPGLELAPDPLPVDVTIWFHPEKSAMAALLRGEGQPWYISYQEDPAEDGRPGLVVRRFNGGAYFHFLYHDDAEFVIDGAGNQVWVNHPEEMSLADVSTYLLGPILGFLLRLQGTICLHASIVAVDGQAIALVGPAGAGKSTAVAAFARMGYPILSDDIAPLVDGRSSFLVQPSYPRVRLWPESVASLYGSGEALPRITPTWEKRYLDLRQEGLCFQDKPLPLGAVYLFSGRVEDPAAPFARDLPLPFALMELAANSYAAQLLAKEMRAAEFDLLGRLVATVPVRQLIPHSDPERVAQLCQLVLADFRRTARAGSRVSR